jgi:hypothetical protein
VTCTQKYSKPCSFQVSILCVLSVSYFSIEQGSYPY